MVIKVGIVNKRSNLKTYKPQANKRSDLKTSKPQNQKTCNETIPLSRQ